MSENPKTVQVIIFYHNCIQINFTVHKRYCFSVPNSARRKTASTFRSTNEFKSILIRVTIGQTLKTSITHPKNDFQFINYDHLQLDHYRYGMYQMFITLPVLNVQNVHYSVTLTVLNVQNAHYSVTPPVLNVQNVYYSVTLPVLNVQNAHLKCYTTGTECIMLITVLHYRYLMYRMFITVLHYPY